MEISRAEVEQIAALARLALNQNEIEEMAEDLASILGHMDELNRIDLGDSVPMDGVSEHTAPFRPDVVYADSLSLGVAEIAPHAEEGFFVVPRLAALDADALTEGGSA